MKRNRFVFAALACVATGFWLSACAPQAGSLYLSLRDVRSAEAQASMPIRGLEICAYRADGDTSVVTCPMSNLDLGGLALADVQPYVVRLDVANVEPGQQVRLAAIGFRNDDLVAAWTGVVALDDRGVIDVDLAYDTGSYDTASVSKCRRAYSYQAEVPDPEGLDAVLSDLAKDHSESIDEVVEDVRIDGDSGMDIGSDVRVDPGTEAGVETSDVAPEAGDAPADLAADLCVPGCEGKCAQAADGCGSVCLENTCPGCCTADFECVEGTEPDACGTEGEDCSVCEYVKSFCEPLESGGRCNCVASTCSTLAKECGGPYADGCGANVTCPACMNGKSCDASGHCVCPGTTDDDCDGADDDCDGQTDEEWVNQVTHCGVGACKADGERECWSGSPIDTCTPGSPAAKDDTCDGVDGDCDGSTDEDTVDIPTTCGTGPCAASGFSQCDESGKQVDTCQPKNPTTATDVVCNGVDDDCDGQTDEDYAPISTCWKTGACATGNVPSKCVAGVESPCKTGTPAASDAICDGVDSDCDGSTDEDAACDDGNKCNGISTCVSGSCQQTTPPVSCTAKDACHVAGTCTAATGVCSNPTGNEGLSCNDDGNKCNGVSTCVSGTCNQTTAPITCVALDACHAVGTCNTSTGVCSSPVGNQGTVCNDDGNKCNGISTCLSGSCTQTTAPITCTASDACHLAGSCTTSTGLCTNPIKTCNDSNFCTTDTCSTSTGCVFTVKNCSDDDPFTTDSCEVATGSCKHVSSLTAGFAPIQAGSFWMGSPGGETCPTGYTGGGCPGSGTAASELGRDAGETLHYVKLTKAFEMQAKEVTQGEWKATYGGWNPSYFPSCGDTCPVEQVNLYEVAAYANAKSVAAGKTACYAFAAVTCLQGGNPGDATNYGFCMDATHAGITSATVTLNGVATPYLCTGYRLPTESEWEYAYRAGGVTAFYTSAGNDGTITNTDCSVDPNLTQIGWYCGNAKATYAGSYDCSGWSSMGTCGTQPGGAKEANAWGLYDMAGNVWEWCWDRYGTYPDGTVAIPAQDPPGGSSSYRVIRGDSWDNDVDFARAANRHFGASGVGENHVGFRLARSVEP